MTPRQVHLVRTSFAELSRHQHVAALVFYQKLFELDPALRPLFKNDIEEQSRKLMAMLGSLIAMLEGQAGLEEELRAMGERHAGYGVRDEHYATVGAALLGMLDATLDRNFTPEMRGAWLALYGAVETFMKAGVTKQADAALGQR